MKNYFYFLPTIFKFTNAGNKDFRIIKQEYMNGSKKWFISIVGLKIRQNPVAHVLNTSCNFIRL